jgi:hypothetical protein
MHVFILCAVVFPRGVGAPPTTVKGKPLATADVYASVYELQKLPGARIFGGATPPSREPWDPWDDGGKFPLDVRLTWGGIKFYGPEPKNEKLSLDVIDCDSTEKAKAYFAQLRVLRQTEYAQSGKYLIKGSPAALDRFTKHYGAVRCDVPPAAPKADKK